MYIPDFWVGVIVGAVIGISALVAAALWIDKKVNKSAPAVLETPRSMATS